MDRHCTILDREFSQRSFLAIGFLRQLRPGREVQVHVRQFPGSPIKPRDKSIFVLRFFVVARTTFNCNARPAKCRNQRSDGAASQLT